MPDLTLSDLVKVRSDKFDRAVPTYLNNEIPLLDFFNKAKVESFDSEKSFKIPFQFQQPQGTAFSGEALATPSALISKFDDMYLSWKKVVGTLRLSEESLDMKKGKYAFISAWARESAGLMKVIKSDIDTALHRRGTGSLCQAASVSGQVVTVDNTAYLQPGMVLDGYDASNNHDADGIVVTAINSDTTFTCTGTVTSVDTNTLFYKEGTWVSTLDRAPMGIDGIVDDDTGTFQNASRSTYPVLRAKVRDGSTPGTNSALSLSRMRAVLNDIKKGSYNSLPDTIYTSIGVYDAYTDLLVASNQPIETIPDKAGFPGGAKFHYGNKILPVVASSKAEPNTMYFLSKPSLFKYWGKSGFADKGGGILQKVSGYLIYEAVYRMWVNFGTTFPEANGRLNDITES